MGVLKEMTSQKLTEFYEERQGRPASKMAVDMESRIAAVRDAVTKSYVDLAVANLSWDFYFNDTGSGIGAYYEMHPDPTGEGEAILTTGALSGSAQDVFQWISDEVVNFETIEAGVIDVHIHARRASGNKSIELYAEIYEYKADTSEVLIATTEVSATLTNGELGYDFHIGISTDYDIASTSKLLVKLLANLGSGSSTTIAIYIEGSHDSHVSVRVPTHTLENLYVRRDILTAQSIIAAVSADTPVAVSMAEQTLLGRITSGNITALTGTQVLAMLSSLAAEFSELRLTPKASSSGAEGTMFYDSDDDHVWVATEA